MSDKRPSEERKSQKIKEEALAIFRDTRSRLDPAVLKRLRDKINEKSLNREPDPDLLLSRKSEGVPVIKNPVYANNAYKAAQQPDNKQVKQAGMKGSEALPPSLSPSKTDEKSVDEPVDRQKIAEIVLQYMKLREDGTKN